MFDSVFLGKDSSLRTKVLFITFQYSTPEGGCQGKGYVGSEGVRFYSPCPGKSSEGAAIQGQCVLANLRDLPGTGGKFIGSVFSLINFKDMLENWGQRKQFPKVLISSRVHPPSSSLDRIPPLRQNQGLIQEEDLGPLGHHAAIFHSIGY